MLLYGICGSVLLNLVIFSCVKAFMPKLILNINSNKQQICYIYCNSDGNVHRDYKDMCILLKCEHDSV